MQQHVTSLIEPATLELITVHGGCPVCGESQALPVLTLNGAPVHTNALYESSEKAQAAIRAPIALVLCLHCGHLFNEHFDPPQMRYTPAYENSLHFSQRFQQYIHEQVESLAARYQLQGKRIIDIGCGKGEFLMLLCDQANATGIGYDPSYIADRSIGVGGVVYGHPTERRQLRGNVQFVRDYFNEQYTNQQADLICSRHVLEHIPEPQILISTLRDMLDQQPDSLVFFEIPNADYMLRELAIWDVVYEHCGFYTRQSLTYLFERHGFEVLNLTETYGAQYLTIEARPTTRTTHLLNSHTDAITRALAKQFGGKFRSTVQDWQERLEQYRQLGKKAAVWGAGTKGVMFLNAISAPDLITQVVDLNPRKQGMFVAGTGQPIIGPEQLRDNPPDQVIVMNPIYLEEVRKLLDSLGIAAECSVV